MRKFISFWKALWKKEPMPSCDNHDGLVFPIEPGKPPCYKRLIDCSYEDLFGADSLSKSDKGE
jgi:hypothetical protein